MLLTPDAPKHREEWREEDRWDECKCECAMQGV